MTNNESSATVATASTAEVATEVAQADGSPGAVDRAKDGIQLVRVASSSSASRQQREKLTLCCCENLTLSQDWLSSSPLGCGQRMNI